jgi:tellurite resistance protein TehA-like permease
MRAGVIVLIIAFGVAVSGIIVANMFLFMMIGEINRKRDEGNLLSYFGFTFPKMLRNSVNTARLYPRGTLHIYSLAAFALGVVGLLVVAVGLRIIG